MIIIDGFRFITHLHTTVRSLAIISRISKEVGKKQIPKNFIKSNLIEWSTRLEKTSEAYKKHKGKLTESNKKKAITSAYEHYVEFCIDIGLLTSLGNLITTTPLGNLLNVINLNKNFDKFFLTEKERLFYLWLFFQKDADAVIFVLDLLNNCGRSISQKELMEIFESSFESRLVTKQKFATTQAKISINEKFRTLKYRWESAEVYSEHIMVPRLEWLADLDVVRIKHKENRTYYEVSQIGAEFYKSLLAIPNSEIHDINEEWLMSKSIAELCKITFNEESLTNWNKLNRSEKQNLLRPFLNEAYDLFSKGGALRMALLPSMLYIIINLVCEKKIIIEFNDFIKFLRDSAKIGNKVFTIRTAARINEGYISVNLV